MIKTEGYMTYLTIVLRVSTCHTNHTHSLYSTDATPVQLRHGAATTTNSQVHSFPETVMKMHNYSSMVKGIRESDMGRTCSNKRHLGWGLRVRFDYWKANPISRLLKISQVLRCCKWSQHSNMLACLFPVQIFLKSVT